MYESFFGLNRRPFCFAPAVDRYFPVANSDAARQALARCIDRAEGVGLLVGAAGLGKSLILQVLDEQFRDRFPVVNLGTGQIETRRELLQSLAHDLRVPFRGMDDGELRLAVSSFLTSDDRCSQGILILADEAHTLSFSILDELRMLTNVVRDGESRVRLVLAGNMRLEEQLTDPRLESLSQRIVCRRYLERFDSSEAAEYIRFQIAAAGGQVERVFEPAAQDAVFQASDGIPRLINQLCDYALLTAYTDDQKPITAESIGAAWAELQQLPGQWMDASGPPKLRVSNGDDDVIEYGGLSDEDDLPNELASSGGAVKDVRSLRPESPSAPSLLHVDDERSDDEALQDDVLDDDLTIEFADHKLAAGDDDESLADAVTEDDAFDSESPVVPLADSTSKFEARQTPTLSTENRAERDFDQIQEQLDGVMADDQSAHTPVTAQRGPQQSEQLSVPPGVKPEAATPAHNAGATPHKNSLTDDNNQAVEDEFESEEVVIDKYAKLEAAARRQAPPMAKPAVERSLAKNTIEHIARQTAGDVVVPSAEEEPTDSADDTNTATSEHAGLHVEVNEDRLQVFVDPYGDLYDDDDLGDDDVVGEFDETTSLDAGDADATGDFAEAYDPGVPGDSDDWVKRVPAETATDQSKQTTKQSHEDETYAVLPPMAQAAKPSTQSAGDLGATRARLVIKEEAQSDKKHVAQLTGSLLDDETIKLPPLAMPKQAPSNHETSESDQDDGSSEMIRPFRNDSSTECHDTDDASPSHPILIIEDDEDDDLINEVDLHTGEPGHNVRMEDYDTLFARLRGTQQSSE